MNKPTIEGFFTHKLNGLLTTVPSANMVLERLDPTGKYQKVCENLSSFEKSSKAIFLVNARLNSLHRCRILGEDYSSHLFNLKKLTDIKLSIDPELYLCQSALLATLDVGLTSAPLLRFESLLFDQTTLVLTLASALVPEEQTAIEEHFQLFKEIIDFSLSESELRVSTRSQRYIP